MAPGVGLIATAKQEKGQSASKGSSNPAFPHWFCLLVFWNHNIPAKWLLEINCHDYLWIIVWQADGGCEFVHLPHRLSETPCSFPCLRPTPCCVWNSKAGSWEARTSTGFQGSERKHSLGDDSRLGQGGSLLSSSVRHGNAVPKAGEWLNLAAHFATNQQNYDD